MTSHAIDYSFSTALQRGPKAIRDAGYTGVLRYVSRPDSNGKNITPQEVRAIRAAGLDLTLNFEQYERRPLEGAAAGEKDARDADRLADKVGYPTSCAIYYSVDFGTSWAAVRDYFRGVKAASRRPVGIYAGLPLCHGAMDGGLARYAWVTNAASWSNLSSWSQVAAAAAKSGRCHLLQHLHNNTPHHIAGVDDVQFDVNTVLNPHYGQWGDNAPEPEEDDLDQRQNLLLESLHAALVMEPDNSDPDKEGQPVSVKDKLDWILLTLIPGGYEARSKATPRTQTIVALLTQLAAEKPGTVDDPAALAADIAEALGDDLAKELLDALSERLKG